MEENKKKTGKNQATRQPKTLKHPTTIHFLSLGFLEVLLKNKEMKKEQVLRWESTINKQLATSN